MTISDAEAIAEVLAREAGYVDDPMDHGGATNMGITQATLADWRGHDVSASDVKALTSSEAALIYYDRFVKRPGLDKLQSDQVRAQMIDIAANSGPGEAVKMLQRGIGVPDDGVLGSITANLANTLTAKHVGLVLAAQRVRFLGHLIAHDFSQAKFAGGWMNRAAGFIEALA